MIFQSLFKEEVMTNENMATLFGVAAAALSGAAVALGIFGAKKAAEEKRKAVDISTLALCNHEDGKISEEECQLTVKKAKKTQIVKTIAWYTPAAVCEIGSVVSIFMGQKYLVKENHMLLDQNNQLMANLTAVSGSLLKQKEVFKDALGEEKYREISNGIKEETIEVLNEKTGKNIKKKEKIVDRDGLDDSSFIFGPYKADGTANPKWNSNMEDNYAYVESMQDFFNGVLDRKPVIFRNSVVEYFDDSFEAQTEAGQYFGKTASFRNPNEPDVRLSATDYMIRDPHGNLVDCLLVQTNLNESVARFLS